MADLDSQARAREGTVLSGKYRLEQLLGVGGMAAVYAATHLRNANRVAVKVLHRELSIDASTRARFLREGYLANVVEHPGTVRVLDDDTDPDGTFFLVMELLEGQSLQARWEERGGKMDVAEVVALTRDLLDVLEAAHAKGVVHRDLKPENLFVTREGQLKVLDFGVARLRESAPVQTQAGAVFGTPAFMPPEQAHGNVDEVDAVSDVWAVGATAFTLLSGRYVHEAKTTLAAFIHAGTSPAQKLGAVAPHVPREIAEVFDRALAFERSKRWPSARAMREALVRAAPSLTASPAAEALDASDAPEAPASVAALVSHADVPGVPRRRSTRALVTAGGVVALVLATAVAARSAARERRAHESTASLAPAVTLADLGPVPVGATAGALVEADAPPSPASSPSASPPAAATGATRRSHAAAVTQLAPSRRARTAACSPPYVVDADGIKRWKRECPL